MDAPGGNGPRNGMYALQKALRKRIDDGLDWLTIKSLPASKDAIPWFWNWADRRYAVWWDSQGLPFVQGLNMLFLNSTTPRIDAEECARFDAANCRAMFCHSQWYRDLIAKHRGPTNKSPIIMWPHRIDIRAWWQELNGRARDLTEPEYVPLPRTKGRNLIPLLRRYRAEIHRPLVFLAEFTQPDPGIDLVDDGVSAKSTRRCS